MYLSEMLEHAVRTESGTYWINDIELHSDKCGVDIGIWWNVMCFNVGTYPIVQVDDNEGNMILWREGLEDSGVWYRWLEEILEDYLGYDDWWFLHDEVSHDGRKSIVSCKSCDY